MIEDTIARIEDRLRAAEGLPPEKRRELEDLLAELRREAATLPELPTREAYPEQDAESAVRQLEEKLTEFETTHPQLVGIVNRISTILANMGI